MARVPVITSPCPLRWKSMPSAGMDFCGQCSRRVHNLDGMNDSERETFFASCSGEVCVAYSVWRPRALAGVFAAAAALGAATSALAQDQAIPTLTTGPTCDPNGKGMRLDQVMVTGGTTKAGRDVTWVDESEVRVPQRPQISEIDATDWLPTPAPVTAAPK